MLSMAGTASNKVQQDWWCRIWIENWTDFKALYRVFEYNHVLVESFILDLIFNWCLFDV